MLSCRRIASVYKRSRPNRKTLSSTTCALVSNAAELRSERRKSKMPILTRCLRITCVRRPSTRPEFINELLKARDEGAA